MATTTSFKQTCPSCEARVLVKNHAMIGRKIECPRCKYPFVVEKPAPEQPAENGEIAAPESAAPPKQQITERKPTSEKKPTGQAKAPAADGVQTSPGPAATAADKGAAAPPGGATAGAADQAAAPKKFRLSKQLKI